VRGETYRKRSNMQVRRGRRRRKPQELQLKKVGAEHSRELGFKQDISNDNLVGNWSDASGLKEPSEMYGASNREHHNFAQQFKVKS
jgi:hypothetical protein